MKRPLFFARELVSSILKPGGLAVDATCGNGHDTLFLADLVGPGGTVLAFDVQQKAIEKTRQRLTAAGLYERVTLFREGHENLAEHLHDKQIDAAMFNLGYLPGGDHAVITRPQTTKAALEAALSHLSQGGIVILVVYTGHAGGREEYQLLRDFAASLPQREYTVLEYSFINQANNPPLLIAITRL